jgi:4-hydroxybenzoate polyprenyltransferase
MKFVDFEKIKSIFLLFRPLNLGIIILTQVLLRYCVVKPILFSEAPVLITSELDFFLLVLTTILIAGGGYVINDYFDVQIDRINKPGRNIVEDGITGKSIIRIHWIINGIAVAIGFFLAYRLKSWTFGLVFPVMSVLLWFYSARYKKTFLLGNVLVAFLSALVILIVWYFEFLHLSLHPENFVYILEGMWISTRIFLGLSLFAFLISLSREIIKDLEDMNGDRENGCRTAPVVLGIRKAKMIVGFLILLVLLLVVYCSRIALNLSMLGIFFYLVAVIGISLIYFVIKLIAAKEPEEFHFLSSICKIIMIAGILTLQLVSLVS